MLAFNLWATIKDGLLDQITFSLGRHTRLSMPFFPGQKYLYIDAKPVRTNVRYLPVLISETTEVCCQIKSHQRLAKLSTPTMRDKCDFGLTNTSKWNEELKASIYKEHRIHRDDSVFCCQGRFNKRVVVWSQKLSNNSRNSWCSWSPYWPWYAHKSWPGFLSWHLVKIWAFAMLWYDSIRAHCVRIAS